jgi:putative hemolysin
MKNIAINILLFTCLAFASGCYAENDGNASGRGDTLIGIADPAAVYARKLGYEYDIGDGTVTFPDGTKCGVWSFYRGRAGQEWSYCERNGGKIESRTEDMGGWTAEYAVCVFPDGSECAETEYIEGECGPGVYKRWSLDESRRVKHLPDRP